MGEQNIISDFFDSSNPSRRISILREHLEPVLRTVEQDPLLKRYSPLLRVLVESPEDADMKLLAFLVFLNVTPAMKDYVSDAKQNKRPIPYAKRQVFFEALSEACLLLASRQIDYQRFASLLVLVLETGAPLDSLLREEVKLEEPETYADPAVGQVE